MLLSGELDVSLSPSPAEADRLRAEPCCRVVAQPSVVVEALLCRVDRPPFDDLRVRRALHLALDRPALVARTLEGWGEPASQLASPGTVGFAPAIRAPARDLPRRAGCWPRRATRAGSRSRSSSGRTGGRTRSGGSSARRGSR